MIVLPATRSVGFSAATASSSLATLPIKVRSRPSRTRWTILPLGTAGQDDEVDSPPFGGGFDRADDADQRPTWANQGSRLPADLSTDDIEDDVDRPDVRECLGVEGDELPRTQVERPVSIRRAAGADHVRADLPPGCVAIEPTAPPAPCTSTRSGRPEGAVVEQPLPGSEARDGQAGSEGEVDVGGQGSEVPGVDSGVLGQGPVAVPSAMPRTRCPRSVRWCRTRARRSRPDRVRGPAQYGPGLGGRSMSMATSAPSRGGCVDLDDDVVLVEVGFRTSARVIPAVPAAWSVTTMAFIGHLRVSGCCMSGVCASSVVSEGSSAVSYLHRLQPDCDGGAESVTVTIRPRRVPGARGGSLERRACPVLGRRELVPVSTPSAMMVASTSFPKATNAPASARLAGCGPGRRPGLGRA